jgi:hypothetical protein
METFQAHPVLTKTNNKLLQDVKIYCVREFFGAMCCLLLKQEHNKIKP